MNTCLKFSGALAGLEAIKPDQGLAVLGALLTSALTVHGCADWTAANLAGPIDWTNLLKTPGRGSSMYAEFRVRTYLQACCDKIQVRLDKHIWSPSILLGLKTSHWRLPVTPAQVWLQIVRLSAHLLMTTIFLK